MGQLQDKIDNMKMLQDKIDKTEVYLFIDI